MKKALAVIMAAVFGLASVSCTSGKKESAVTSEVSELKLLKAAPVGLAEDLTEVISLDTGGQESVLIFGKSKKGGYSALVTDNSFVDCTTVYFYPAEGEKVKSAALMQYGKIAVLTWLDGQTKIYVIGSDGKQEKEFTCGEIITEPDEYARIYACGSEGFLINVMNEHIDAVSAEGKYRGEVAAGGMIGGVSKDADGNMTCIILSGEDGVLCEIDTATLRMTEKGKCDLPASSALTMCSGLGDYSYAGAFIGGICVCKDGKFRKYCDMAELPFDDYEISNIIMTGENELAVSLWGKNTVYLLTERDISEIKNKKVVTVASFAENDIELNDMIRHYNTVYPDSEYRVEVKTYVNSDGQRDVERLSMDIVSGNAPDIVRFDGSIPIDTFAACDSLFYDMYELIDKDPEFDREDFLPNVLKGCERNGKLVEICPLFTMSTVIVQDISDRVKENWTLDDAIAVYDSLPENMDFFSEYNMGNTRDVYLSILAYPMLYIDFDKCKCFFDSPEYIRALNFVQDNNMGCSLSQIREQAEAAGGFLSVDESEYDTTREELVSAGMIFNFETLYDTVKGKFHGNGVIAGYPCDSKRSGTWLNASEGMWGIMANSDNIDGAWSFLREYFTDWYYNDTSGGGRYAFPVIREVFDQRAEALTQDITYYDDDMNEKTGKRTYKYPDGSEETIENCTPEECEHYKDIVLSAELMRSDNAACIIISEENERFYAGECSAEEAAAAIQDRVTIYLSEKYN